jgi:phosphotransferase system  glucose/maltose/N-acetylglucosamine-specific IIC component
LEFFITWTLALGLLVVPGLINYYVNRYYTPAGSLVPTLELVAASLALTFATLTVAILVCLVVALGWDDLKNEISDFVQLGLRGYGQNRPIALSGVLAAVSLAEMALMALLGALRIPSRFVR